MGEVYMRWKKDCQFLQIQNMPERNEAKPLKKRKSQESFFLKGKFQPCELPQRPQAKRTASRSSLSSLSLLEIQPKRRVNSLQISSPELAVTEQLKSNKSQPKGKQLNNCLSDRNVNMVRDPQKLFKYRKFSSNAELQEQMSCSVGLKHKLSVLESSKENIVVAEKNEQYPIMVWILAIRKYYSRQHKNNKQNPAPTLPTVISHLSKLQKSRLESIKFSIQRSPLEPELSREKILSLLQNYFKPPASQLKPGRKDRQISEGQCRVSYLQVLNCLVQHQLKVAMEGRYSKKDSHEDHEDAVETARFQEGGDKEEGKRIKKYIQIPYVLRESAKKAALKQTQINSMQIQQRTSFSKEVSPLLGKSKQSLHPSLSPFSIIDSRSISNSRSSLQPIDSEPTLFKQALQSGESSLGMLTLEGKSPRQLMESEIFESMQRRGVGCHRKNNISFSLDNLQEPHAYFQQTVSSFEEVLKKIKKIQSSYLQTSKGSEEQQPSQEINLFLEQLIDYRMTVSSPGDNYSYFATLEDIKDFKDHSQRLMLFLLQSSHMRDFLLSLEGLKICNSPQLLTHIQVLLHPGLRIINLANNRLSSISDLLKSLPEHSALQFLNISHNSIKDITPALLKLANLRELHAKDNSVSQINAISPLSHELKTIDLSHNQISKQSDLAGLSLLANLQILNLAVNPLTLARSWKASWSKLISLDLIYEMDNLYVMSDYGHHKDIAFSSNKKLSQGAHLPKIRTFVDGKLI